MRSSPRTPCGRATWPILMRSTFALTPRLGSTGLRWTFPHPALVAHELALLLDDLEDRALAQLGRGSREDRAHRPGRAPLLADHLAEVFLGDLELEDGGLFSLDLVDLDGLGTIDQRRGDEGDQLLEGSAGSGAIVTGH